MCVWTLIIDCLDFPADGLFKPGVGKSCQRWLSEVSFVFLSDYIDSYWQGPSEEGSLDSYNLKIYWVKLMDIRHLSRTWVPIHFPWPKHFSSSQPVSWGDSAWLVVALQQFEECNQKKPVLFATCWGQLWGVGSSCCGQVCCRFQLRWDDQLSALPRGVNFGLWFSIGGGGEFGDLAGIVCKHEMLFLTDCLFSVK